MKKADIIPADARIAYSGHKITLHAFDVTLPGGTVWPMELFDHPGASAIVAFDDDERVVLIRQYRHATGGYIWEIPAGTLDKGEEAPLDCARRELEEETGFVADTFESLGAIYTVPSFCNEIIHLFLARGLTATAVKTEPDEVIDEIRHVPVDEALNMIDRGEIVDAKSIAALFRAERSLRRRGRA